MRDLGKCILFADLERLGLIFAHLSRFVVDLGAFWGDFGVFWEQFCTLWGCFLNKSAKSSWEAQEV